MSLQNNNPAGEAPTEALASPPESEIMELFGLNDTSSEADNIANSQAGAASVSPSPAEGGSSSAAPAAPPEPSPAAPEAPQPPAAPEPAPAPAPQEPAAPAPAAPAPQPAAPTPQPVDEQALRLASQNATIDALQRELAALRANPQGQGQQPQPAAPENAQARPTLMGPYSLSLPQPIKDAIASGDGEQVATALGKIANDLATVIHHNVVSQVRVEIQGAIQDFLHTVRSDLGRDEASTAREQAKQAYYEAFPGHNNPLVLPIIQAETQKMAAEFPNLAWGPDYMNALGARVDAAISAISGGAALAPAEPQPAPQAGQQPPARPAPSLPSGPRSGTPTAGGDISDEIMGVLDPFAE